MGSLVIRLIEGKNLKTSSENACDAFVRFSLINTETQEKKAKKVSRVVKKSANPVWNDTLTLQLTNPKGHSLRVAVYDQASKRIGSKQPLGDTSIPLDDFVPSKSKDLWLSFPNGSGSIHLILTHRVDPKSRILISYGDNEPIEYELLRGGVKLSTQIDLLCQLLKAEGSYEAYSLQLKDAWITQENLADPRFVIPEDAVVKLMIRPNVQVQSIISALKTGDMEKKKKAIFGLRTQLQDSVFANEFVNQKGITLLISIITETTGNALAYALAAVDSCLNYGFGWDQLTSQIIEKIVSLLDSNNLNVKGGALKIAVHLASSKNLGYPAINSALWKLDSKSSSTLYTKLVESLQSNDIHIQLTTVKFFNAMLSSAPDGEKQALVSQLERVSLSKQLKKIKSEMDVDPTPYNKDNKEHEAMLMELWNTLFPNTPLESRVSEQWKKIGFQGTDPATDFRAMGIVALKHLIYFAKKYTKTMTSIIEARQDDASFYPVAVAGINISKMMFDLFSNIDDANSKLLQILFDHENALEELYCIVLQYFDKTWEETESTYMDFSNVIASVGADVLEKLKKCSTIESFRKETLRDGKVQRRGTTLNLNSKRSTPFLPKLSVKSSSQNLKQTDEFHDAVKSGDTKKVSDMIRGGVSVNAISSKGVSALHTAVLCENIDMVRLLLWKDADVDIKNQAGWTPLHEAAKNSSLEICELLIHKGANPNAETPDGSTPLHYIASRKFEDINAQQELINAMLAQGVDVNHNKNSNNETPLHYAVTKGLVECTRFLVRNGADVNLKSKRGYSALHIALLLRNKEILEILLEYGADLTAPCKDGTPGEMVRNAPELAKVLSDFTNKKGKFAPTKQSGAGGIKIGGRPLPAPPRSPQQKLPPTTEEVLKLPYYHGSLSRESAEQLLISSGPNTFLLRPSSVKGCCAMTVYSKKEITHYLIYPKTGSGYGIQDCEDTNTYKTIAELAAKSSILKGATPVNRNQSDQTELVKKKLNEVASLLVSGANDIAVQAKWAQTREKLKRDLTELLSALDTV